MRVYDCFMFFNELDLLEIRLNELKDVVDYFVLCESPTTHSGKPKPLYYAENKERFAAFNDRIIHVTYETPAFPEHANVSWDRERYQRGYILNGLVDAADDDVVMLSDMDEIPKAEFVRRVLDEKLYPCTGDFSIHYLYADWKAEGVTQGTTFKQNRDVTDTQVMRETRSSLPCIPDAGWHLSYMGGVDKAFHKLESFAHTEFFWMLHYTKADVQAWYDAQETQFSKKMTVEEPNGPRYLLENRERFVHFFSPTK